MRTDICSCLKILEFIKNIIASTKSVKINTNIFYKNINDGQNDLYQHEDLYKINTGPKNKISYCEIMKLFKHMNKQFKKIENYDLDEYIYISNFKYNERKKIYEVKLIKRDKIDECEWYTYGVYNCIAILKFIQKIIGLKNDVTVDSAIYSWLLETGEFDLDERDDLHILFGNADKKITLDDIYDLFMDIDSQFKILDEKLVDHNFLYFEGIDVPDKDEPLNCMICWSFY